MKIEEINRSDAGPREGRHVADWKCTLELGDVYHVGLSIPKLAGIVSERLEKLRLPMLDRDRREEIAADFLSLSEDQDATADEFDEIMAQLFDWADTKLDDAWPGKRLCWVNTMEKNNVPTAR